MSLEKRQLIACEVKRLQRLTGIAILTPEFQDYVVQQIEQLLKVQKLSAGGNA